MVAVPVVLVVVGNLVVVRSSCHDEIECGCLTRDKNLLRFRVVLHARCRG